jgi:hypothetical protein
MADEKKNKKRKNTNPAPEQEQTSAPAVKAEDEQSARGDRGELGTATAKLKITQLWRAAHFTRKDANDKGNFRKRIYVPNPGPRVSLKKFARELLKAGDPVAKAWFANKRGAQNAKRLEKNASRITLEKQASKAARRKKAQGKQGKAAADATVAAAAGKK